MSDELNVAKIIRSLHSNFTHIEESPLVSSDGKEVGWHSSVILNETKAIGSGTASTKLLARRIAVAESIERGLFYKYNADPQLAQEFFLDKFSSSTGFAVGFEPKPTEFRSQCEAVEHWAWSQWIDSQMPIQSTTNPELNELSKFLASSFSKILFFERTISANIDGTNSELKLGIAICLTDNGVFPGSRVTSLTDSPWEHALVEAHRNLMISRKLQHKELEGLDWIESRILYFSKNKDSALDQIPVYNLQDEKQWPIAQLKTIKKMEAFPGVFICRSLCDNFIPWHLGSVDRFVY